MRGWFFCLFDGVFFGGVYCYFCCLFFVDGGYFKEINSSSALVFFFQNPETKLHECRVRFLSFMGIALENVK